jgi:hypothetical protein
MSIVKRFLEETGEFAIKVRLESILSESTNSWTSVDQRAAYV